MFLYPANQIKVNYFSLFCLQVALSDPSTPIMCPTGSPLPQLVVSVTQGDRSVSACNVQLTNDQWSDPVTFKVKATTDQVYDGNNNVTLTVTSRYVADADDVPTTRITSQVMSNDRDVVSVSQS